MLDEMRLWMSQTVFTQQDADALQTLLEPIVKELRLAETAIKSAEKTDDKISLVAINQARNGFNHLCVGLNLYWSGETTKAEGEFSKSKGHCTRAYYDACDAELTFCLMQINGFIEYCSKNGLKMHEIINDYSSIATLLINAKNFLTEQNKIEDKLTRYQEIVSYRDEIKHKIYDNLSGYSVTANEKIDLLNQQKKQIEEQQQELLAQKKQVRKGNCLTGVSIIVAIVAIIVAVIVAIYQPDLQAFFHSGKNNSTTIE